MSIYALFLLFRKMRTKCMSDKKIKELGIDLEEKNPFEMEIPDSTEILSDKDIIGDENE